jgi:hypothetical protein
MVNGGVPVPDPVQTHGLSILTEVMLKPPPPPCNARVAVLLSVAVFISKTTLPVENPGSEAKVTEPRSLQPAPLYSIIAQSGVPVNSITNLFAADICCAKAASLICAQ